MRDRGRGRLLAMSAIGLGLAVSAASGQETPRGLVAEDTLTLGELHRAALARDARARQAELNDASLALRLRNLAASWLPELTLGTEARYQTAVPSLAEESPFSPAVPKQTYEATIGFRQQLYDGGRTAARRGLERARMAEQDARLTHELYGLRREVDATFFSALTLEARAAEVRQLVADLESRFRETRSRVDAGDALPGDAAILEAELLRARQQVDAFETGYRSALSLLELLTGLTFEPGDSLWIPDLDATVEMVRRHGGSRTLRDHPLFAELEMSVVRLEAERSLALATRRPALTGVGEFGYGRPGPDFFNDSWDPYAVGGVRITWTPWRWGAIGREAEVFRLQSEVLETEAEAFASALDRASLRDLEEMNRLERALESDERIGELRARVERQVSRQLTEGAVTAARYVEARTDLLEARLAARLHRIELAEVRARYLSTLGVDVP